MPSPSAYCLDGLDARAFWARVAPFDGDKCRPWLGRRAGQYGGLKHRGKYLYAHRAAWVLTHGQVGLGLVVRHRCDNPLCCNLSHLELGTARDNVHDVIQRGRRNDARGERRPNAVLTEAQVLRMRDQAAEGATTRAIAAVEGLPYGTVFNAISGANWAHLPTGERRRRSKLSRDDVAWAREWCGAGWPHSRVANALAVTPSLITMIMNGRRHAQAA